MLGFAFLLFHLIGQIGGNGGFLGDGGLHRPHANGPSTHPITVVMAIWLGVGMLFSSPVGKVRVAGRVLFLLSASLALLRLVEMAFFDQSWVLDAPGFEGLAASLEHAEDFGNTGLNTLVTGILIALGQLLRPWRPRMAMFAAVLAPVAPVVAVFGYSFGLDHFHGEMAPTTAAILLPISLIGVMNFVRRPVLRSLFADTTYGRGARMEILAGIGFPWLLGAVLAQPEAGGTSSAAIQSALMAIFAVTVVVVKTRAHAITETQRQRTVRALRAAAVTDHLTGLTNRHGATARIDRLAARRPVAVILADLDHFKMINDIWGHASGDGVLAEAAKIFKDGVQPGQMVARWGGEEFLVLLPGHDIGRAMDLADQLRRALATLRGPAGSLGEITASFGVSERYEEEATLDGAIQRADAALYAAKDSGRDRVVGDERVDRSVGPGLNENLVQFPAAPGEVHRRAGGLSTGPGSASTISAPGPGSLT